jgi:hypothetical protein
MTRALPILAIAALAALPGCKTDFSNSSDRLREENLQLQNQVNILTKNIELRLAEVKTLEDQIDAKHSKIPGAQVPRLVKISFGRYSGLIDSDRDKLADTLRVYVVFEDQQGRFLPSAGKAVIQIVDIRPGQTPKTIAEASFDPKAVDQAYRSGITGTHYTFDVAVPNSLSEDIRTATVKMTFTEASTGVDITVEKDFDLSPISRKIPLQ